VLLKWARIDATATWLAARPVWVQGAIAFLMFEVLGYWYHRLSHTVPFLWRFHSVHHSSSRLTGCRRRGCTHSRVLRLPAIAPPSVVLGVSPRAIRRLRGVHPAVAILLHANIRWRLRRLDGIWGTPEDHHWHHSNHRRPAPNFSGQLRSSDMGVGTYYQPKDRRPELYGIDEPMPSWP